MCPSVWKPSKKQAVTSPGEYAAIAGIAAGSLYIITAPLSALEHLHPPYTRRLRLQLQYWRLRDPPRLS